MMTGRGVLKEAS